MVTLASTTITVNINTDATTPVADYWVDGAEGSDSNDGLSDPTAFQTFSKLDTTIGTTDNTRSFIKGGQTYRQMLELTEPYSSVRGYTGIPIFDGSDVITGWTAEGTANVWQKSVTHSSSGTNRMTVYNTAGVLLTRVANVATCSSTPGSFVDLRGSNASPWTVKVHPTSGDTDPEGYFVTTRNWGLFLGDNATVNNVYTRRSLGNNGSLEVGKNSSVSRALCVDGTKHNMLIGSGTLTDVVCCRNDAATIDEPSNTPFVAYTSVAEGETVTATRCFAVRDGSAQATAWYNHGGAGSHDSVTFVQFASLGYNYAVNATALAISVDGSYIADCLSAYGGYCDDLIFSRSLIKLSSEYIGNGFNKSSSYGIHLWENVGMYAPGSNNGVFRLTSAADGIVLEFRNCTFDLRNIGFLSALMTAEGMSSGTIKCNNCLFVGYSNYCTLINIPSGVTYEGNNNVFVCKNDSTGLTYHGSSYQSLALWQAATGQDANSLLYRAADATTLFSGDTALGDFRLQSTGTGLAVQNLSAGIQEYWDWNTRAAVSGQPPSWPDVPSTLAECETYVADPAAWDFYP